MLPGGQSGNPFSPHYADQMRLWLKGDALPIHWSPEAVARATRHTLVLDPLGDPLSLPRHPRAGGGAAGRRPAAERASAQREWGPA